MLIAPSASQIAAIAFAGALLLSGAIATPSAASQPAPHFSGCAPSSPRFEPSPRAMLRPQVTAYPGGAKRRSLVGEPCLAAPRLRDV